MQKTLATLVVLLSTPLLAQTQFVVRTPTAITSAWPQESVAADFDGDGDLDLLSCIGLFGGMPARRLHRNDGNEAWTDVSASALPPQSTIMMSNGHAVASDFDGDGDVDVFSSMMGGVVVWRNLGTGTFVDTGFTDMGGYTDLVGVDLDSDGDLDVAASGQALAGGLNTVFLNQGNCSFARLNVLPTTWANAVAAADIDSDGDQDLLLGSTVGVLVLRNLGGFTFTDVSGSWVGTLVPGSIRDLAVGDLDGDGDRDIVVARQGVGSDDVLLDVGGTFAAGVSLATGPNGTNRLALVDVDADGDLDLWRGGNTGLDLQLGDGLGGFTSGATRHPLVGGLVPALLPFDCDRDGDLDLLVCDHFLPPALLVNRHRDLVPGQPAIGQAWTPVVWTQPGYATGPHFTGLGIATSAITPPFPLPPFGDLAIDLNVGVVFSGMTTLPGSTSPFALAIPNHPTLVGLQLFVQGIVAPPAATPRFTASFGVLVQ